MFNESDDPTVSLLLWKGNQQGIYLIHGIDYLFAVIMQLYGGKGG